MNSNDQEKARRRRYNTEWARRRREEKLTARLITAQRCPRGHGGGVCGGQLRTTTGENGRTLVICDFCERRKAGICRDCSRPTYGPRAIRCAEHAKAAAAEQLRAYADRNRDELNERGRRAREAMSPEKKAEKNAKRALWRAANPDKVRASKRRYAKRYGDKQDSRYLEYHRRYNAQATRASRKRAQAIAAYYRDHPDRPDPKCIVCHTSIDWKPGQGRPATKCDQCCSKYELAARIRRREAAALRAVAPVERAATKVASAQGQEPDAVALR